MKYSIQAHIKTSNNGIRNAVQQLIPSQEDPRIWSILYQCVDTIDEDGKVLVIDACFETKTDRDGVVASMKGLQGVINACDVGSYVLEYKCFHDEVPLKKCEQETILRKE